MGWRLISKPKTQLANRELAKRFADMDSPPYDRPLSERRLMVYHNILERGEFRPVTWASAYVKETRGLCRVNGKHTSTMLSGLAKLPEFYVVVEEYECDTLEDLAKLYSTFDSKMCSRTANDIYLSFASTMPEMAEISKKVIIYAITGISYHLFGNDANSKMQPAERAEALLDHPEFALWLQNIISSGPVGETIGRKGTYRSAHLLRMPVVAAMFGTWLKTKADATKFWSMVRDETGESPDTPDRKLARYLITTSVGSSSKSRGSIIRGKMKTAGQREFYVKCIHAWNAWRSGEETDLKYFPDAKIPAPK